MAHLSGTANINERAPRPVPSPVMFQHWKWLAFLHWRYRPEDVAGLLPSGLTVDTYDGAAWIGLTPFIVSGLRAPFVPAIPWISEFPETNVRTYVRGPDGAPGVWFFTLESARLAAVVGARMTYGLPYRWARMKVSRSENAMEYTSTRAFGSARNRLSLRIGDPIVPGNLDVFLTARFRLYTRLRERLAFADVEHEPWPLRAATITSLEQNLVRGARGEPLVHWSEGVDVRVGRPRFERRAATRIAKPPRAQFP